MSPRSRTLLMWLEGLSYDLRIALRGLRRDRSFTLASIAMLALAIGLNVTVFTVMDAMLFRGFPLVKRNDRLVYVQERSTSGLCCVSYPDFEDWRSQTHVFEGMAFVGSRAITFGAGRGRPMDTSATTVTTDTFGLLGVPPMLGRDFVPADEQPGAAPVVILSYDFWRSQFGKRQDILGLAVQMDGAPAIIVGVMPEHFDFPSQQNMWVPLLHTAGLQHRGLTPGGFLAVGRLTNGTTAQAARAQLETINRGLEAAYPATNHNLVVSVVDNLHFHAGPNGPIIYGTLWAAGCLVLLIACANLTNLALVRSVGRWREFSIRIALGAGQWRMLRHMLMESVTIGSIAAALGWAIANWSICRWSTATASRFQILDYTLHFHTLVYLVVISAAAAILFSVAPTVKVWQLRVHGALAGDARVTPGPRGRSLSGLLIACQMALAIVLLSGAGVLVRSLWNVVDAQTGVRDPANILVGSVRLPSDKYPNAASRLRYFARLDEQLKTIPGIETESVATNIPVSSGNLRTLEIEGRPSAPGRGQSAQFLTIGPDYFRVVGAAAISGRAFNEGDRVGATRVAMVNQSFADNFFPGEQPLGKRLRIQDRNQPEEWIKVVGVVSNIMQGDPIRQRFLPLVYLPMKQESPARAFLLARTKIPLDQVAGAVRAEVQKLDSDVTLETFTSLKATFAFDGDYMDLEHMELGKDAAVAPVFAVIAMLLAAIGLYAVIAHSVGQRTKEIGVRMAIGAAAEDIRRMVLRDGMSPVVIGMIGGLMASLAVNRVLQSQLVEVSPYDPVTMAGAPVVLILVALIACQLPARRAMNVDPAVALRQD